MRFSIFSLFAIASLALAPGLRADGLDLTFSIANSPQSGYSLSTIPDANCYSVAQANCVLFTGTLTDTDNDPANFIFLTGIQTIFSPNPANGGLTPDNTFGNVPAGILSGDTDWATDGNFSNTYTGLIFGIQIAPNTPAGAYQGIVTINAQCGDDDPFCSGFSVSAPFEVDVLAPEPASLGLFFAGLLPLGAWLTMKRKWRSLAFSR